MTTQNLLFLDIETLPPSGGGHLERIKSQIKAPASYKKPESIAAWLAENADAEAAERMGKLALDGLYGQVCVIGFAVGDGDVVTVGLADEEAVIATAFEGIQFASINEHSGYSQPLTVVGHNVADFDLRFLLQRAVRYGIKIPACIKAAFDPDKGRYHVIDTMKLWAGYRGYVKLKDLTRELCGDVSDDIDGADVAAAWAKNPQLVAEHCKLDVARTRSLYNKIVAVL